MDDLLELDEPVLTFAVPDEVLERAATAEQRTVMRRTYGVGANLGYHPVARAALYGAADQGPC